LKNLGLPSKKAKSSSDSNIGLKINGEICFDKAKVCDMFNCCYTTVASTLVSKLPVSLGVYGKQFVDFFYSMKGVFKNSFSFALVSESTVLKYINHLSHSKATGLDGIPARFVKDGAAVNAGTLTHIINLSLIQGRVPDDLKWPGLSLYIRKVIKLMLVTIALFLYFLLFLKYLKELFMTKLKSI